MEVVVLAIYRMFAFLVGLAFAFMGYKLFTKGIYGQAGDLQLDWKDTKVVLRRAAPGTFFALFGVLVIGISIMRKIEVTTRPTLDYATTLALHRFVSRGYLEKNDFDALTAWLKSECPSFPQSAYTTSVFCIEFVLPQEAIEKVWNGEALTDQERIEFLRWLASAGFQDELSEEEFNDYYRAASGEPLQPKTRLQLRNAWIDRHKDRESLPDSGHPASPATDAPAAPAPDA